MNNNQPITRLLTLAALSLMLAACGGGGSDDLPFIEGVNDVRDLDDVLDERDDSGGDSEVIDEDGQVFDDIVATEGNISVRIPGRSLLDIVEVVINTANITTALPAGMAQVGDGIRVTVPDAQQEMLNGPVIITVNYGNVQIQNENNLVVLFLSGSSFQPVTILSQDTQANTLTFESRRFNTFALAEAGSPPALADTGFQPDVDGWVIENFGDYFAPGGNSFGMSGFAAWHFSNSSNFLGSAYLEESARIAAARIQISQGETWGSQEWRQSQTLNQSRVAGLLKSYLSTFNGPLVLTLGNGGSGKAGLVYAYDSTGFFFYDPDIPGESQFVSYDGTSFGQYQGLGVVGFATLASFGRDSDFQALAQEAEQGFAGSANLAIDTPVEDEAVNARETTLSGSFLNDLSTETLLYAEVKGIGRQLSVTNGNFSNVIEVSSGANTIVALAGVDSAIENNWFKDAPTAIRNVVGTLPPAVLLVTLTWEQNDTDVDLYVYEPDGETMWFGNHLTSNGLELDFDDTTGFGPEHGTLEQATVGDSDPDVVLDEEYVVRVHYFSDDGLGVDATGKVTIIINEGQSNQNTLSLRFTIESDNSGASGPEGTGPSWVDIARINLIDGTFSTDFSDEAPPL